jgi:hypothetical protein
MKTWLDVKQSLMTNLSEEDKQEVELEYQKARTQILVNQFIEEIVKHYPTLEIHYSYDFIEDEYDIWHSDFNLQFNNKEFHEFAGKLMLEYFYKNGIYNFSFGYDYYKSERSD